MTPLEILAVVCITLLAVHFLDLPKRAAKWVFGAEWIPLGPLAPYVLGIALGGKMPHRVKKEDEG